LIKDVNDGVGKTLVVVLVHKVLEKRYRGGANTAKKSTILNK